MENKIDKKNALKKMLNEKTLLEMSGGADLDSSVTNIPGGITLNGKTKVSDLMEMITGIKSEITELKKTLGGASLSSLIATLDKSQIVMNAGKKELKILPAFIKEKITPVSTDDLGSNNITGFPLYIADQIAKSTGNNNPKLSTGMIPGKIKDIGAPVAYIKQEDIDLLASKDNGGINRYLTLYDLITNDDGQFLSSDLDFILNRFSSLAQFKHLPALEYLATGMVGGSTQNNVSKKNRSRKVRK